MKPELIFPPKEVSIGTTKVLRVIPRIQKRNVGPFVFLDHMGPEKIPVGKKIAVLPHPHIGLSTVTYLFEGKLIHRDSTGVVQAICPNEINWMTSGRGISHSERSDEALEKTGFNLHGLQFWIALPADKEDMPPDFQHIEEKELPLFNLDGCDIRLLAGSLFGKVAQTKIQSPLILLDIRLKSGKKVRIPTNQMELGIYIVKGSLKSETGEIITAPNFILPDLENELEIEALEDSIVSIFGGENFPEPRFIDWNFVSTSKDKIQSAKIAWKNQDLNLFGQVPGESDYIKLPF
jgi:redox-sensitive bicupin YhaK (pirin superfamily)